MFLESMYIVLLYRLVIETLSEVFILEIVHVKVFEYL